jgi:ADP-ribose pyrophosphatase YjhB (NUDIX family)
MDLWQDPNSLKEDTMMDYVQYIRSMVGNEAINLTGVNVLIINDREEVLLQKRGEHPVGKWGLIGGIVELGESLEDAAIREAKEETNLDILELKLLGTTSGKEMYVVVPNGHKAYFISIGFYTKCFKGEMKIDGTETTDLRFFKLHDLPTNMPKSHRRMIDFLQKPV